MRNSVFHYFLMIKYINNENYCIFVNDVKQKF